jgi:RNA polymerase sigma-70 factor (ECF subfamily)
MEENQERQWLLAAVAGDRTALQRLMLLHHDALLRHLEHEIPAAARCAIDPEDVLQETYLDVFAAISGFVPGGAGSFYSWVRTIARHRLLDLLKARRALARGGGHVQAQLPLGSSSGSLAGLIQLVAIDQHTPSSSAAGHEAESAVQAALAMLKSDYRQVLHMRYVECLSPADIARMLGRSEGSVFMTCSRALKQLRALMAEASHYLSTKG